MTTSTNRQDMKCQQLFVARKQTGYFVVKCLVTLQLPLELVLITSHLLNVCCCQGLSDETDTLVVKCL